ncbi:ABC transporter [Paenibacillus cisolokensis]|uniref:ABC transporter n=1 Tax=Paenibacillus cisolokensis TaxID=1658519 RepID=A0ABQ4NDP8_9BACL|nr:ABC transporter ATP-binding protein [Paenibacillus cisolokensis]GIQ66344.1 ABC transporter [Paenibacillus cisolokensis]
MFKLKRYLRPYWLPVLLAPLLMLVEVIMDLLQPMLMASIVDDGVMKRDLAHIQTMGLIMIGVAIIGLIGGVGCSVYSTIASQSFGTDLRRDLFRHIQTLSFANLDRLKIGSLITRLTNDIVQLQNLVQMLLRIFVRAPLLAIGSIAMAIVISPRLALILGVAVPLLFVILFLLIRLAFPLFSGMQAKLDKVNSVLQENLAGIRVVKAFVRAAFENSRFSIANHDYTDTAIRAIRIIMLNMPMLTLVLNLSIVAVLWFGGNAVWQSSIAVGDLIAFINYVTQVLFSLSMIGMMLMAVSRAKVSADRVNEVFDTEPEIANRPGARTNVIREGRIEFDRVTFRFGAAEVPVLHHISFTAEPGKTVAILGSTGAGKSSLVSLVPRLYDATEGQVRIDGVDVRDIDLDHLRSRIGLVLQESVLFTGTIRDNIRYGRPDASDEEIEQAARAAQAHEFIANMPEGYDTMLGQRGVNLSGGQKQRIAIARALLVRPVILILDDSTSAVDLGTESRIRAALAELMRGCTTLLIAQRITSVMDADHILVLEEGKIAAAGSHAELMRHSDIYRDIYRSQLGEEEVLYDR